MVIYCKKCGLGFGHHSNLVIDDDPNGYRCTGCYTLHSWIDGSIKLSKARKYKVNLGSTIGQEVK